MPVTHCPHGIGVLSAGADEHNLECAELSFAAFYNERSIWADRIDRIINPPVVMPFGYFIPDLEPGGINTWRRLYGDFNKVPRPLAALKEFEEGL